MDNYKRMKAFKADAKTKEITQFAYVQNITVTDYI